MVSVKLLIREMPRKGVKNADNFDGLQRQVQQRRYACERYLLQGSVYQNKSLINSSDFDIFELVKKICFESKT